MAPNDFVKRAKEAGYKDEEIVEFLGKKPEFAKQTKAAREHGYKPEEIVSFLSSQQPRKPGDYAAKLKESPKQQAGNALMKEAPGKAAGALAIGVPGQIESIIDQVSDPAKLAIGLATGKETPPNLSQIATEKLLQGLPPEQQQAARELQQLSAIVPIPGFGKALPGRASPIKASGPKPPSNLTQMALDRAAVMEGMPPRPSNAAQQAELVQGIAGENLPTSMFETAEQGLAETSPKIERKAPLSEKVDGLKISPQAKEGGSLQGRQIEKSEPGNAISPREFENDAIGGAIQAREVRQNAANARQEVTNLYNQAEQNYQNINSIGDAQLLEDLEAEAARLEQSVRPNTAESNVINTIRGIQREYEAGNGLPVGRLIKGSDSVSGMANYELPFTGPKEILKRVASILDRAAMRAIDNNGGNSQLLREANRAYGRWANRYANDEITPFLERTINNPEALFRKSTSDEGTFRAVEHALHDSPNSGSYVDAMARKVAEKKMKGFKSADIGSKEYNESIRNLRALIGDSRANAYDRSLRRHLSTPQPSPQKVEIRTQNKLKNLSEKIAEHSKKKPETILSKLNSRSGIRELKNELPKKSFETLIKQKARSILQEGNIEHKFTGDEMFKILNKEENFEIFSELLGKEEAMALKDAAKELGRKAVTAEAIKDISKSLIKATIGIRALKVLVGFI